MMLPTQTYQAFRTQTAGSETERNAAPVGRKPAGAKHSTAFVEQQSFMAPASQGGSVQNTATRGPDSMTCPAGLVFASDSVCVPVVSHLTDTVIYDTATPA
jgi:hypothetical protein